MSGFISTERLFSLACIEGLRLFRKYGVDHPELQTSDLLALIDKVEAGARSLDMEASAYLSTLVDADCPLDGHVFYQACIKGILIGRQPVWAKLTRRGRTRFVENLDANDQDVFAAAGLMENPTSLNVVKWWDEVSGFARLVSDREKVEQGRNAEILTLEHERKRLKNIGIEKEPEWPGFDDNFAGYDVLSYDNGPSGIINKLIEVKSTTVSPLRFIVTRNEWNKAEKAGEAYLFHLWDMIQEPPVLHTRTVAEVAPHVPTDNGKGSWKNAEIPIQGH